MQIVDGSFWTALTLKCNGFRQFDGMQVDRMKLNNFSPDDCHTKLVLKPSSETAYWKVICEPKEKDLRILTKKIPLGSLFNFQVFHF